MSFGISVSDFFALSQYAWTVYKSCRDAPEEFKAVSEELASMRAVLKGIEEVIKDADLSPDKIIDLSNISQECTSVLSDLENLVRRYSSLGTSSRRTWDRLKWGKEDTKEIRARLVSATTILTAFNSSLLHLSQNIILETLQQLMIEVQAGKKEGSVISTTNITLAEDGDDNIWHDIVKELGDAGIPEDVIEENREFITTWIKKAFDDGNWCEQSIASKPSTPMMTPMTSPPPSDALLARSSISGLAYRGPGLLDVHDQDFDTFEVVSATYGVSDVTEKIRQFCTTHLNPNTRSRSFIVGNVFFGKDPLCGFVKAFVLVWRMRSTSCEGRHSEHSVTKTLRTRESHPVLIDYKAVLPPFFPPSTSKNRIIILDASYFTMDVTATVAAIVDNIKLTRIAATNDMFDADPAPGQVKQLSVTYGYCMPEGRLSCQVRIVREGQLLTIPPLLIIQAANWGGVDITDTLRAQITPDQTLQLDTKLVQLPDPWYGVLKTLSIMYQYGDGRLQLLVSHDGSGIVSIDPEGPMRTQYFNPAGPRHEGMDVLAVIWGVMYEHPKPVSASQFDAIATKGEISCTNEWFGFDGLPNWQKTCQVFFQHGSSGKIYCSAGREGTKFRCFIDSEA
ncbi:MAG: hypothetical protein M1827_001921 [Pycnora praestabilis]|nr:MAG: hypothetical protein M1827_001921 [Pycnora praestabilis]